jgi:hypothetical protein
MRGVGDRHLLEFVVEPFALGDLERFTDPFVVGAEAKQSAHERLVSAVAFPGARKGAVELKESALRSAADEAAREKSEAARASRVGGRGTDHHGSDYVKQAYRFALPSWNRRLTILCSSSGLTQPAFNATFLRFPPPFLALPSSGRRY